MPRLSIGLALSEIGGTRLSTTTNICITAGSDTVDQGFRYNTFGTARPEFTKNGTRLYEITWVKDKSSSLLTIKFGDAGDKRVESDIDLIIITFAKSPHVAQWDDTAKAYLLDDQDVIDDISHVDGDTTCFYMGVAPDMFIHYGFTMIRGDEEC
jgi:hypothetical protein